MGGGVREWQRSQSSGVRTCANALIQKNNETASATVKINFVKILETNQKLIKIQGVHLRKTDKPCLEHITMPQTTPLLNSPKNQQPCKSQPTATGTVNTCSPAATGRGPPWKAPFPEHCSRLPGKVPFKKHFYCCQSELTKQGRPHPQSSLTKTIRLMAYFSLKTMQARIH